MFCQKYDVFYQFQTWDLVKNNLNSHMRAAFHNDRKSLYMNR